LVSQERSSCSEGDGRICWSSWPAVDQTPSKRPGSHRQTASRSISHSHIYLSNQKKKTTKTHRKEKRSRKRQTNKVGIKRGGKANQWPQQSSPPKAYQLEVVRASCPQILMVVLVVLSGWGKRQNGRRKKPRCGWYVANRWMVAWHWLILWVVLGLRWMVSWHWLILCGRAWMPVTCCW